MDTPSPQPPVAPPPSRKPKRARILQTTLSVAILLATLFTTWTPAGLFSSSLSEKLSLLLTAQPEGVPTAVTQYPQLRIGIVAGHWGNDSGAVCRDTSGQVTLSEVNVNLRIANLVQKQLTEKGFLVDLLQEFDPRLNGYRASLLVSIHNDSCDYIDDNATGFKVAAAMNTRDTNRASRFTECLRNRYQAVTGLPFHAGSITSDMREYHAFSEIDSTVTIAAIIETGFLNLDREILTQHPDIVADGIVQGIVCFINNENIEPTSIPTFIP
jgi:N-acetylmuramoyl-L-alanine amidase